MTIVMKEAVSEDEEKRDKVPRMYEILLTFGY